MNKLPLLGMLLVAGAALAQGTAGPEWVQAERARIAAERAAVEARHAREEVACRARFAVNDCVRESTARRRVALSELRKQELAVNAAERQQRAEERRRALADKAATPREGRSLEGEAPPAAAPAPAPPQPSPVHLPREPVAKPPGLTGSEREQAHQRKLDEAAERKQKVLERNARRTKPAASPLPIPD
ncbi:hypothetical protein JI739_16895 [Ramlibacter sp. AW1]|uniref:Uncharacterized protein n=1 Tax=Ramlibacter aurantiacus TaxID=2801330 RepID=A0A937D8F8_9BURK|nr:hypothetical protein [Ramlibacter aurantiacus]MBL0422031.1 hypothetical protein [Ramlibacter aurantiacus]